MKKDLVKLAGGILLGGVAMLVVLAACSGPTQGTTPAPAVPAPTATAKQPVIPGPAATVAPATTPTAGAPLPASPQPTGPSNSDLLAQGKLVFEKTAGGVGCAFCHGLDGKGKGPAGLEAANIRGATEAQVRTALAGGVPMMGNVTLGEAEIAAVVVYLQWLATQP